MASKSSFCGPQVSTLSKYKLLFLSYHSTEKWEQLMFTHRHTWLSYNTLWWHGRYEKYLGNKTSCVTVARCSTLRKYKITDKIRFTTATWVKTLKGCITLKEPCHSYGWKERLKVRTVAKSESDLLHHCCNRVTKVSKFQRVPLNYWV